MTIDQAFAILAELDGIVVSLMQVRAGRACDFLPSANTAPRLPVAWFDTESTSLDTSTAAIVQLAACVGEHTFEEKVWSERAATPEAAEAAKIHGLTAWALLDAGARPTGDVLRDFGAMLGAHAHDGVLVAYNGARFDFALLRAEWERAGLEPLPIFGRTFDPFPILALAFRVPAGGASLGAIYEYLMGKPLAGAHDALADVRAMAAICERLDIVPDTFDRWTSLNALSLLCGAVLEAERLLFGYWLRVEMSGAHRLLWQTKRRRGQPVTLPADLRELEFAARKSAEAAEFPGVRLAADAAPDVASGIPGRTSKDLLVQHVVEGAQRNPRLR